MEEEKPYNDLDYSIKQEIHEYCEEPEIEISENLVIIFISLSILSKASK